MIRVNFLKEDWQVVKLLNVARVFTNIIVKVGKIIDHTGVVQEFVCAAGKIFMKRKDFRLNVVDDICLLMKLEKKSAEIFEDL
jgi:hypothetical protein